MKMRKFIKFWWEYNDNSATPSSLFIFIWTLALPFISLIIFYLQTKEKLKKTSIRRKKFFKEWNKIIKS